MNNVVPASAVASLITGVRPPGGLYAADCDLVFTKVVFPLLKCLGYQISFSRGGEYAYVIKKDHQRGHYVRLVSISKVKVRLYGNRHGIDRHVRHDSRWDGKRMRREVAKLWSESLLDGTCIVILIGYGRAAGPLRDEIEALELAETWNEYGVSLSSSSWPDPHARGFHAGLYVWTRGEVANQSPQITRAFGPRV